MIFHSSFSSKFHWIRCRFSCDLQTFAKHLLKFGGKYYFIPLSRYNCIEYLVGFFDLLFFAKHSLHFGSKVWIREHHTHHLAKAGLNFLCKLIRAGYFAALPSCHYHLNAEIWKQMKMQWKMGIHFFFTEIRKHLATNLQYSKSRVLHIEV